MASYPGNRERAMRAIASVGVCVPNDDLVSAHRIPDAVIDNVACEEQVELERRERAYRNGRAPVELVRDLLDGAAQTVSRTR